MSKEIQKAVKDFRRDRLKEFGEKHNFEWSFNPPKGSHMGGAWEIMIRSVKEALFFTFK